MKTLYTATVTVRSGRDGRARSDDGLLDLPLAMPAALGGPGGATNPEQLFAAGFGACFASSVRFAAKGKGLDAGDVTVAATARLVVDDDGAFGVAVRLAVDAPNLPPGRRDEVLTEAKRICAYSNATRGLVDLAIDFPAPAPV